MNTRQKYAIAISFLMAPVFAWGQDSEKKNVIAPGFLAVPAGSTNSIVVYGEYERFLNEHNSLSVRLDLVDYSYEDRGASYVEKESGSGGGVGFSYKHYFGNTPYGGFFLGPGLELVVTNWEWSEQHTSYTDQSEGTTVSLCPNGMLGYRFNLGNAFSLTPSAMLGVRVAVSVDTTYGDAEPEAGPFGGLGLSFGFRF